MIFSALLVTTTFLRVVVFPYTMVASVDQTAIWIITDDNHNLSNPREIQFKTVDLFIQATLNQSVSITSNSIIYFRSGSHTITVTSEHGLVIQNIANITTKVHVSQGDITTRQLPRAKLVCHNNFGLSFFNITNLTIYGIDIEGCLVSQSENYALKITNSFNVLIHTVSISHGQGIGLYLLNVYNNLNMSYIQLTENAINCYIHCYNIIQTNGTIMQDIKQSNISIEHANISFGKSYRNWICSSFSSGLSVNFNQTSYIVHLSLFDVILQDNIGHSNAQINTTSCCWASVIQFTHVHILTLYNVTKYGISYHELQCSYEGSYPRRITLSHSRIERSCIYAKLYDNNGLRRGVSETHISLQNTSISNTHYSCLSSLEAYNIHYITLNNVEVRNGESPFIIRVDNNLDFKSSFFSLTLSGYCKFKNNKGGISLIAYQSYKAKSTTRLILMEESNTVIKQNRVPTENQFGSTLSLSNIVVQFRNSSHVRFIKNKAYVSGGIAAITSNIQFIDNSILEFIHNSGKYGGAMALYDKSQLSFHMSNSTIKFINNSATHYGGAIYIDDSSYLKRITNIFVAPFFSVFCCMPHLEFRRNKASLGGSAIYGGWIDWINNYRSFLNIEANISQYLFIEPQKGDLSQIASKPSRICVCQNERPNCSLTELKQQIHPGGTYSISAVAVGQRFGTVTSQVEARFNQDTDTEISQIPKLGDLEDIQIVNQKCTRIKYSPRSSSKTERLWLTVSNAKNIAFADKTINELKKDPTYCLHFQQLSIEIEFLPCPFGFQFNVTHQVCECIQLPKSVHFKVHCDVSTFKLIRQENTWLGIDANLVKLNQGSNFMFGVCPFEFCDPRPVELSLENIDKQCNFNRSGILCGACRQNLSMVFGSPACRDCSNKRIALVLIGFALVGMSLITLLFILNLTISTGTVNGLIFYANIINISTSSFIPSSLLHSFIYNFISALNLGVGSELCFYRGMNAHGKSWLRLAFPSYILILSVIIIVVSHYSIRVSKLLGRNPVQVLATLFLLTYAKFLDLTVANSAFGFTTLQSANGKILSYVWHLDGNVPILSANHAFLFLATLLLLLFVCIPYTVFLIFVQPLQKYSHVRIIRWTNKLKPFIDAHTGPYKDRHQYWTGLLLLVRSGFMLLFTINSQGNQLINMALVVMTTLCLTLYILAIRGIYKSRLLSVIEIFFMTNLFLLSICLFLLEIFNHGGQQESYWIVNISIGCAFVYFCLVVLYHIWIRIRGTKLGKRITNAIIVKVKLRANFSTLSMDFNTTKLSKVSDEQSHAVTHSSIELRETLLGDD